MEKDGCVVIAEVELEDGVLSVVKDNKYKKWYHVFKNTENVQPNHDSEGVMRYLAHVLHSVFYKHKKEKEVLESKLKTAETILCRIRSDGTDADLFSSVDDWEIIFPVYGGMKAKNNKTKTGWKEYNNFTDLMKDVYDKKD